MDYPLCEKFDELKKSLPDELENHASVDFNQNENIKYYCPNGVTGNQCETELDKINAACLWLFNENIANGIDDLSNEDVKSFIIYIMIWLNYMLNLKNDEKTNLNNFYTIIEKNTNYTNCTNGNSDCSNKLKGKTGYNNFKEIIDNRKDLLNINFEDIFKFYDAFKLLCKMHTESNKNTLECNEYLVYANKIVDKFKELNESSSVTGNTSYSQIWSTLSTDYDNFKENYNDICRGIPSFPPIKKTQHNVKISEDHSEHGSVQNYGVTSSSLSIVKKLILALSIFSAITIFLGIFYKGSLFVLRKRAQKQHLREKLKNIKKRMNH
ncbi:PIR protein [Plasmodium yoelii]|uniref:PIR protein n=3 Tax=Plasmodium yoelii TaxID=5861 RepID=A0AAE9WKP3_PLAYO|nr:PIR protein [Plasmodium yoelii]EAA21567.1 putative yir1 protein [Plasmodium yoelii yoelii]WBY55465.1 PIR protein [Plasmodium yoelii yoelii]CDS44857.1 YIR protein [Plasmodium yoelii]VTZ73968.1 PIR protein [Plasmodium yoelii]|eukprot:XP_034493394.1 PIR protein [Plasmodium yoelii]